ncbi:MAG: metallophosphoesterase, partial [Cyanobacteriota bacterium]
MDPPPASPAHGRFLVKPLAALTLLPAILLPTPPGLATAVFSGAALAQAPLAPAPPQPPVAPPSPAPAAAARGAAGEALSPLAVYALMAPREQVPSGLLARAVLPAGVGCPVLETTTGEPGGPWRRWLMRPRQAGASTLRAFESLLVCEAPLPLGSGAARIAGRPLPAAMPREVRSLAIFGDTGCRLKDSTIQACNDPEAWPLAQVARSLVNEQADVVLYLGDFFYREMACPAANDGQCGGSPAPLGSVPFTDSGWGWVADVLVPMAPLLATRPLMVLRGNHELCSRGGNGYFLLFDPATGRADRCAPEASGQAPVVYSPTWAVELSIQGGRRLRLVNVDSANGNDSAVEARIAIPQRVLFAEARRLAQGADEAWLLTHRPVNA